MHICWKVAETENRVLGVLTFDLQYNFTNFCNPVLKKLLIFENQPPLEPTVTGAEFVSMLNSIFLFES